MKTYNYTQIMIAHGHTAEEFEKDFNAKMRTLSDKRATWEIKPELGWAAIITWDETERVCESLTDEYECRGEVYYCGQCPYLERINDMRRKQHPCRYSRFGITSQNSRCCEKFYQDLQDGIIEV